MLPYWPDSEISATQIQSLYEAEKHKGPRLFLKTGLGGLAPEIRQQIYNKLLAIPPAYVGRDYRARETRAPDRSPISLATFVDLKESCLTVLQTCRQIYIEAFPTFYAGKSYYLANSRDFATCFRYGGYLKIVPYLFRLDTITSLCLKDLVINRLKWSPQQIDHLMSRLHTFNRVALETERTDELDSKLTLVDLEQMKSLRKICLCMRVGQEWEYLRFLFNIRGLRRGVIEFLDNFHWAIRSQNASGDDWSLQYSAFPNFSYKRGKNFEILEYHVFIQREVLDIDSRASDLVKGDERWVEVDIGSRNYEEMMPERQHPPDVIPNYVSENQQTPPIGEGIDPPTDDGSDRGSESLQGSLYGEEDGSQMDRESDHESEDLQGQSDGAEDDTHRENDNDQYQQPGDLQGQPDGDYDGAKADEEPDQESGYPENLADGDDHNAQAESDPNQESETSQTPPDEDYTLVSIVSIPKGELEDPQGLLNTEDRNASAAAESNQELEGSVQLVNDKPSYVQAETGPPRIPTIVPEGGNKNDLEAQPGEKTSATTELSSRLRYDNYRDAKTQTESVDSECGNADTQTELGMLAKDLRGDNQVATVPPQEVFMPDQGAVSEPKVPGRQRVPTHRKLKPVEEPRGSAISQPGKTISGKSPQKTLNSPILEKPKARLASVDDSTPTSKRQCLLTSHTKCYLYGCVRAAALMLALSLFYVVLYAKRENALGQLLALMLFILLCFVVPILESDS